MKKKRIWINCLYRHRYGAAEDELNREIIGVGPIHYQYLLYLFCFAFYSIYFLLFPIEYVINDYKLARLNFYYDPIAINIHKHTLIRYHLQSEHQTQQWKQCSFYRA